MGEASRCWGMVRTGGVGVGVAASVAAVALAAGETAVPGAVDLPRACADGNPYLVTVAMPDLLTGYRASLERPVAGIVMFRDTPKDSPHYLVAAPRTVGSVLGLAFRAREDAIYSAAFHERGAPFGPGGPGAIYRTDLRTGETAVAGIVPDPGADRHDRTPRDRRGRDWATKTSLGDVDIGAADEELYVVNLNDRRIYRFAVPTMALRGSFPHGAYTEDWAEEARPFGLGFHDGRLFHAVTRTGEVSHSRGKLEALVYSSQPSGADMRLEARFDLDYRRGNYTWDGTVQGAGLDWHPWRNGDYDDAPNNPFASVYPMPIVSDIVFSADDAMILGVRDRHGDVTLASASVPDGTKVGLGVGDLIAGKPHGATGGWSFEPAKEHFEDGTSFGDESALGGLAAIPGTGRIVTSAVGLPSPAFAPWPRRGAYWYEVKSGSKSAVELVGSLARPRPRPLMRPPLTRAPPSQMSVPPSTPADDEQAWELDLGDVEALCAPPARPSPTPRDTPSPQPSATAPPTQETPSSTRTATSSPTPIPLYLPLALREEPCLEARRAAVALVIDTSSSMLEKARSGGTKLAAAVEAAGGFIDLLALPQDQAAVVGFDSTVVVHDLTSDPATLHAQLASLSSHSGTMIHLGVTASHTELMSQRRRPENYPAMVVLTDGRATNGPEPAIRAADIAKADGVYIFTIGLGDNIDREQLLAMASEPSAYFEVASAESLSDVYAAIAVDLPCPAEEYWGGR